MTQRNPFATESREKVVKSNLNSSISKQLWTFPKRRRFQVVKPECPHSFYQQNLSALSNIKIKFTSSSRRLFTDNAHSPSPADYVTNRQKSSKGNSFGLSRQKCKFNSYIQQEPTNNPGPTNYDKYASQNGERAKRGYTMRPNTAKDSNYFIENRQLEQVPGPADYQCDIAKNQNRVAKFRSVTLGGVGLMKKSKRFQASLSFHMINKAKTPGPSEYEPKKATRNVWVGGIMGSTSRTSFIDQAISNKSPGPGDYFLPSQFGHYKKVEIRSRMATIQ